MILQEKLDMLLSKYAVGTKAEISADHASVKIGGESFPLYSHRFERRIEELRKLLCDGTITGVSVIRINHMDPVGSSVEAAAMRELDICRFVTGREVVSLTVFENSGRTSNIIAKLDNDVVCTVEISALLPAGSKPIDKHEITSQHGVASDRVVDTQVPQSSIYMYTEGNGETTYQDVDFELYGLSIEDCAKVRAAFALARSSELRDEFRKNETAVKCIAAAYNESAKCAEKVVL